MIIQYEKTFQGAHRFYAIDKNGDFVNMQYFFTSKAKALAAFKRLLRGEK